MRQRSSIIQKKLFKEKYLAIMICLALWLFCSNSLAHLLENQKGTINFTQNGAFLAVSIPVSGLSNIQLSDNGGLSIEEFNAKLDLIKKEVLGGITLQGQDKETVVLRGLILNLVHIDHKISIPALQLMVLGRFIVRDKPESYSLKISLFGENPNENKITITATANKKSQILEFTEQKFRHLLFS